MGIFGFGRTRIFLARHGEIDGAKELCLTGHTDKKLTPKGLEQSRALAERLATHRLAAVYSSGLSRTHVAAELIAERQELTPQVVPDLKEMFFGKYEGMPYPEAMKKYQQEDGGGAVDLRSLFLEGLPSGENMDDLWARIIPAFEQIIKRHEGESVAVVSHGGVNRVVFLWALALPREQFFSFEQDHGCLNILDFSGKHVVIRLLNSR